jgi:hypothetical protein
MNDRERRRAAIQKPYEAGEKLVVIGAQFNITPGAVSNMATRWGWKRPFDDHADYQQLRRRWANRLPSMRAVIRATAGGV